jgi:phosphoglycerate dehydrogenase-like enzyme
MLAFGNDPLTERVLEASKELRIIARNGIGVDRIDMAAATRFGIAVCNAPGANADAVAEFTFALMLNCSRRMQETLSEVSRGGWAKYAGVDLAASTLGVVGLGSIAKKVIKRAHAFGMRILVFARRPDPAFTEEYGVTYVSLDELLAESDFVSLHLSLNDETHHLIDYDRLSMMKPTAYLINTARGGIVDTAGLRRALEEKLIAGAALDVHEQEPLKEHPLPGFDNVLVSPHAGAATATARDNGGFIAADNLARFFQGQMPPNLVDPGVFERLKDTNPVAE